MSINILTRVNEKNNQLIREEELEKQNAIVGGSSASGSSASGSRKSNDDRKNDEEEFTRLLNIYAKHKSKYDQHYKTLTQEDIQSYREEFKRQEESLSKAYNLLKNKKTKYYCGNYTIELCKKENRIRLTDNTLGKMLFRYFRTTLKDKAKDEVNKYVLDIINFINKERITNESLYIKCNKKNINYSAGI